MNSFQRLFGVQENRIQSNCLLLPLLSKEMLKGLGGENFTRGRLYGVADGAGFTLVHSAVGAGFNGDAVLYLKDTPCKNIFLFGSSGLVAPSDGLGIGSLVTPEKCFAYESFSDMLAAKGISSHAVYPSKEILEQLSALAGVTKVTSATLGSLKLEEQMVSVFRQKGIDVVDMECSAVFAAAASTGLNASALFYISDIINIHPFYQPLPLELELAKTSAIKKACQHLCSLIKKNPGA